MMISYAELATAIENMTIVQRSKPVKVFNTVTNQLHPECNKRIIYGSRITNVIPGQDPDYTNKDKFILEEYLPDDAPDSYKIYDLKHRIMGLYFTKGSTAENIMALELELSKFGETPAKMRLVVSHKEPWDMDDSTILIDEIQEQAKQRGPYVPFVPTSEQISHQVTYDQLYEHIIGMTDIQKQHPVQMFSHNTGLQPDPESSHPDYGFDSKFVSMADDEISYEFMDEDIDPDQYVVYSYMSDEGTRACCRLHAQRTLNNPDATFEQKENARRRIEASYDLDRQDY